jgi:8-oxo-dGTP pyrophosphatase MutT (NUDIX family)
MIRAAGAVLWRMGPEGDPEVAVIRRPRYGDWSLPKGKLEPGETALQAAVREVAEETGQTAEPGMRLGETRYVVSRRGERQDKIVEYWAMQAQSGDFVPGREVDALRWLPLQEARDLLTYDHDRAMLDEFAAVRDPSRTATFP